LEKQINMKHFVGDAILRNQGIKNELY